MTGAHRLAFAQDYDALRAGFDWALPDRLNMATECLGGPRDREAILDLSGPMRRVATIAKSPRREWLSFLLSWKCPVRLLIRSVRIATWTSGLPVSPSVRANFLISSALRSAVIDIGILSVFAKRRVSGAAGWPWF